MTATDQRPCQYRTVGPDGKVFFTCQRNDAAVFGLPDGGWIALCSKHADWAKALGCRV